MIRSRFGFWVWPLTCSLTVLTGCDVLTNLFPGKGESGSSELKRFSSEAEFASYMRDQINGRNSAVTGLDRVSLEGGDGAAVSESPDSAPSAAPNIPSSGATSDDDSGIDFSGTTIQEAGVDESDAVKTDGTHLYVMENSGYASMLRIVDVADRHNLREMGEVALDGYGQDIYLVGDKVVALTSRGGGYFILFGGIAIDPLPVEGIGVAEGDAAAGSAGAPEATDSADASDDAVMGPTPPEGDETIAVEPFAPVFDFERPRTVVTVIDVSNPESPTILSQTAFDGSQASSRMIDGVLHLVLSNYQDYYVDVLPLLGRPGYQVDAVDPVTVLPNYERRNADGTTSSGQALTWENLYRPTDPDGFGLVYVTSIDVNNDAAFSAVGIVAEPGLIYSSREALYLTDTNYDFRGNLRSATDVYKLAYSGQGATPVATGSVPGRVLNQYSMSEHQSNLRVATTVDPTFSDVGTITASTNSVYVLGQSEGTLTIVGRVENVAPRETIQAARFLGDRGYLVTFEQIDPLFTLDLSDPTNPRVIGELEVPGFSTFIVPIDANHLLTVGQYVPPPGSFLPWGVQLSIFDVTDFAHPTLMDNVVIGDETGAYSEALYNPKAFTYYAQRGVVALPISIYDDFIFFEDVAVDTDVDAVGGGVDGSTGATDGTDASPPSDVDADTPIEPVDVYVPGGFEGLLIYEVSLENGLSERGRISTRFESAGYYWASFTRGVFIEDDVLAVTDHGLRGAPVTDIASAPFELLFTPVEVPSDGSDGETSSGQAVPEIIYTK